MSTTSTPHRRSTGRTRSSLSSVKVPSLSSASPSSSQASVKPPPLPVIQSSNHKPNVGGSSATRKPSLGYPLSVFSPQSDSHNDQRLSASNNVASSSLTMTPSQPTASRNIGDDKNGNQNLEVGDYVDVPGGMHGTIKFIGEVRGKKGTFAGVELAKEWAARGKNDGDVDGSVFSMLNKRKCADVCKVHDISRRQSKVLEYSCRLTRLINVYHLPHPLVTRCLSRPQLPL